MTPLVALLLGTTPLDSEAGPFPYTRPSVCGKYVFVMLRPDRNPNYSPHYVEYTTAFGDKSRERYGHLYNLYPKSGLYRKRQYRDPLWTVDWYSFDAYIASDGQHLVRFGPWARLSDEGRTLAVAFYRDGKELGTYDVRDLVKNFRDMPPTFSHYFWYREVTIDHLGKRLKFMVYQDQGYKPRVPVVFDLTTGKRLQTKSKK